MYSYSKYSFYIRFVYVKIISYIGIKNIALNTKINMASQATDFSEAVHATFPHFGLDSFSTLPTFSHAPLLP